MFIGFHTYIYGSILVALAQILLFLEMPKFSKDTFSKRISFVNENEKSFEIFSNILLLEIESPKLFNHSADMCQKRPRFYRIDNSLIDRPPTPPPRVLEETFMWSLARTSCKLAEYRVHCNVRPFSRYQPNVHRNLP